MPEISAIAAVSANRPAARCVFFATVLLPQILFLEGQGACANQPSLVGAQADLAVRLLDKADNADSAKAFTLQNAVLSPTSAVTAFATAAIGASPKFSTSISGSLGLDGKRQATTALLDIARKQFGPDDETAIQAAAATAALATRSALTSSYMRADASALFLFYLRQSHTGLILAAGIMADPAQALLRP